MTGMIYLGMITGW